MKHITCNIESILPGWWWDVHFRVAFLTTELGYFEFHRRFVRFACAKLNLSYTANRIKEKQGKEKKYERMRERERKEERKSAWKIDEFLFRQWALWFCRHVLDINYSRESWQRRTNYAYKLSKTENEAKNVETCYIPLYGAIIRAF